MSGNTEPRSYRIQHVLGQGGFGAVYRAEMLGSGGFAKPVAVKILAGDMKDVGEVAQRMRDEARMLGLLRHRAIVNVDGLVMLDGRWAIIMEFVDGVDLGTLAAKDRVPVGPALEILEEVASALSAAYTTPGPNGVPLHVLHRDIKPQNIQLTARGEVKVLDFGIAKAEFDSREAKTQSMLFGSAGYMAPERLDMIERHEGDVYSVGVVLYELLTSEAFGKAQANPKRHDEQVAAARARLTRDGFPSEVITLFAKLTQYEPDERPTAEDVARSLRSLRRTLDGPALPDWAPAAVKAAKTTREHVPDAMTGRVIVETTGSQPTHPPEAASTLLSAPASPSPIIASTGVVPPAANAPVTTWEPASKAARDAPPSPPPALEKAAPAESAARSRAPMVAAGVATLLAGSALVVGIVASIVVAAVWFAPGATEVSGISTTEGSAQPPETTPVVAATVTPTTEAADTSGTAAAPKVAGASAVADALPVGTTSADPSVAAVDPAVATLATAGTVSTGDECGARDALEKLASKGELASSQRQCFLRRATDPSLKLTEQEAAGRALIVNDYAACKARKSCDDYESFQRLFFEKIDRSDPDMMLAFAVHLWNEPGHSAEQDREVVVWSDRALENKSAWQSGTYIANVSRLMEMRAKAAYRVWQDKTERNDPAQTKARGVARTAAVDWMDFNLQLGREANEATELCLSLSGTVDACRRGTTDAPALTTITLTSIPMGLALFIDGEARGKTPQNLELAAGTHELRMVRSDGTEGKQSITVGAGQPVRYGWKSESGDWTQSY